jgi:hypothetical protein
MLSRIFCSRIEGVGIESLGTSVIKYLQPTARSQKKKPWLKDANGQSNHPQRYTKGRHQYVAAVPFLLWSDYVAE